MPILWQCCKNTITPLMFNINCKGKLLKIDEPIVMGILNVTPDSFYKGYLNDSMEEIRSRVAAMIHDGAAIIDVGGQSTRPGSEPISASNEIDRIVPIIDLIKNEFPDTIVSIDTYYSKVAKEAVSSGASIVNDVSAGEIDPEMIDMVGELKTPYICMHMKGTPNTMQIAPEYENVTKEVLDFFIQKKEQCSKAGILDIVFDPGFGFGKTNLHNFSLLHNLSAFKILECPILAGLSRKGMIYKSLQQTPSDALNGTTVLNTLALNNGANILRVHDVKEAKETITLFKLYKNAALN